MPFPGFSSESNSDQPDMEFHQRSHERESLRTLRMDLPADDQAEAKRSLVALSPFGNGDATSTRSVA